MYEITDYSKIFEKLVDKTASYLMENKLKAMILGISGGIDSTVVAAICCEVSKRTGIPLIGRSLPTKHNKEGEITTADLVGKAFCNSYKEVNIEKVYNYVQAEICEHECALDFDGPQQTPVANGNIQARLRMIYLYNLASIHGGLVMDTDNLTENNLGYFTIHGDVGDFNPIGCLWKTEVFKLAEWLKNWYGSYTHTYFYTDAPEVIKHEQGNLYKARAIRESLKLKPTAGLGITDSDLDEIGADSYEQIDSILQEILKLKELNYKRDYIKERVIETLSINTQIVENILDRYFKSVFKRKQLPVKITRDEILL